MTAEVRSAPVNVATRNSAPVRSGGIEARGGFASTSERNAKSTSSQVNRTPESHAKSAFLQAVRGPQVTNEGRVSREVMTRAKTQYRPEQPLPPIHWIKPEGKAGVYKQQLPASPLSNIVNEGPVSAQAMIKTRVQSPRSGPEIRPVQIRPKTEQNPWLQKQQLPKDPRTSIGVDRQVSGFNLNTKQTLGIATVAELKANPTQEMQRLPQSPITRIVKESPARGVKETTIFRKIDKTQNASRAEKQTPRAQVSEVSKISTAKSEARQSQEQLQRVREQLRVVSKAPQTAAEVTKTQKTVEQQLQAVRTELQTKQKPPQLKTQGNITKQGEQNTNQTQALKKVEGKLIKQEKIAKKIQEKLKVNPIEVAKRKQAQRQQRSQRTEDEGFTRAFTVDMKRVAAFKAVFLNLKDKGWQRVTGADLVAQMPTPQIKRLKSPFGILQTTDFADGSLTALERHVKNAGALTSVQQVGEITHSGTDRTPAAQASKQKYLDEQYVRNTVLNGIEGEKSKIVPDNLQVIRYSK